MRLRHATVDVLPIAEKLGLAVSRSWRAGEPRASPNGRPLPGEYAESYCACELDLSALTSLEQALGQVARLASKKSETLTPFIQSGGTVAVYIGLQKGLFEGAVLNPQLLQSLAIGGISLEIDRSL